jgi:hypothetical protein
VTTASRLGASVWAKHLAVQALLSLDMEITMADGQMNAGAGTSGGAGGAPVKRDQSTIGFPYVDLEGAIGVARKIHESGGIEISRDQLAAAMNLAPGSGNFVVRVAAARLFGLIEFAQSKYTLTERGHAILDPAQERRAKAEAFLQVPLYKRAYDEFRGKQLPPRPLGIEQAFVKFGVAPKQKDKARVAFDKSASQAGYFSGGNDRLVEPIISTRAAAPERSAPSEPEADSGRIDDGPKPAGYHPFVEGLLATLPKPDTVWPVDARKKWLIAAENIFELIYKKSDESDDSGLA